MEKKLTTKVFVYGVLKSTQFWHKKYLGDATFISNVCTDLDHALYVSDRPRLVEEKSDRPVFGELYEVSLEKLAELDDFEGHPINCKRKIITVTDENGNKIKCHTYLFPNLENRTKSWAKEYVYV